MITDLKKAIDYVDGCVDQCDSIVSYERTVGIIDFLTHLNIITPDQNISYRDKLHLQLKKHGF